MNLRHNELQAFDDLPQDWSLTTLGSFLPLTYGKALRKGSRDASGDVPVYGSSGQVGVHSRALTKGAALIVGRKGSVGEVHRSAAPCWPIDTVYYADERDGVDLRYCEHLLRGLRLSRLDKSTAVPGLSRDDYNAVQVAIAPLDQQKRIVAEIEKQFSRLDEAIADLNRVKANLKRYKAAVLKAAVEGHLVETEAEVVLREGRSHPPSSELHKDTLELKHDSTTEKHATSHVIDLPALPWGWIWSTVEKCCERVVDCHNKTAPYTDEGILLLRTSNIRDGKLTLSDVRYVNEDTYRYWSRRCPPVPGDLLFTREAPMGEVAIIPEGMTICMGQRMMVLRRSEAINPEFLLYALMSPTVREVIDRLAVGSGVRHLRVRDVGLLPVPLPPLVEQDRIVAQAGRVLSIAEVLVARIDRDIAYCAQLHWRILQRGFTTRAPVTSAPGALKSSEKQRSRHNRGPL